MSILEQIQVGLKKLNLDTIPGSPFDNPFNVFNKDPELVSLVVLGTNGNITDAEKTNLQWIEERALQPDYSHVESGDWGKSPLQGELLKLPDVLNSCFDEVLFSKEHMILTNGLLLASAGVKDIAEQFKAVKENGSNFNSKKELITASMSFFKEYTLSFSKPKVIFAYGNDNSGDSAWKYIKDNFIVIREIAPIPKTRVSSYKFCLIELNGHEIPVIGSPHLSYGWNKLDVKLIKQGLIGLGIC